MSRYNLTVNDKLEIIDYYEREKPDIVTLAERFNIGKTQAANILKNTEKIREDSKLEENKKTKYFSPQGKIIDTQVYDWYLNSVKDDQPISGKSIKEKALEIARSINYHGFCASNGWLQRWRVRHNVSLKPPNQTDMMGNFHLHPSYYNNQMANGVEADYRRNVWQPAQKKSKEFQFPVKSRKAENHFNKTPYVADDFDPLAFTEVSYGNETSQDVEDDDDEILLEPEITSLFKVDSFASALTAVEDLKNFAQDDDVALKLLNQLETHFQTERLK